MLNFKVLGVLGTATALVSGPYGMLAYQIVFVSEMCKYISERFCCLLINCILELKSLYLILSVLVQ